MAAKNQNFEMFAGDSKEIVITVTDDKGVIDLSSATIKWVLKKNASASTNEVFKASGGGISISNGANGEFTVSLDAADTKDLNGVYYHEAEVTDSQSKVSTVTTGQVTINLSGVN